MCRSSLLLVAAAGSVLLAADSNSGAKARQAKPEVMSTERFTEIHAPILQPQKPVDAGLITEHYRPEFIDINFGCPVKKGVQRNGGSGCLRDMDLVAQIIRACVQATHLPVTVKTRSGWNDQLRDPVGDAGERRHRHQLAQPDVALGGPLRDPGRVRRCLHAGKTDRRRRSHRRRTRGAVRTPGGPRRPGAAGSRATWPRR